MSTLSAYYYFSNYLADVVILEASNLLTWGEASMKHLCVYANLPSSRPRSILWPGVAASSQFQSVELGGWHDRGGGPGSGLGSSSGTGADRAFRIVKSETMKRVDHKR